jgi:hypothetical protein
MTVESPMGSLINCYLSFQAVNFPCFLLDSLPILNIIKWRVEAIV